MESKEAEALGYKEGSDEPKSGTDSYATKSNSLYLRTSLRSIVCGHEILLFFEVVLTVSHAFKKVMKKSQETKKKSPIR